MLIIANIKVEHTTAGTSHKVFANLVGEGSYSYMLDCYLIT